MSETRIRIGIVGATGAVGRVALSLLEERGWPASDVVALASARSKGKWLPYADTELEVVETTPETLEGFDVVFISASSAVSREFAPIVVEKGGLVIDDGSAFRMEPEVPLVVPEVNGGDVLWHRGIISIPNCTTTPLVMVLDALRQLGAIERVTVATYQAVSGTGAAAVAELNEQTAAIARGASPQVAVYPYQIAMNVLPHVDSFKDDGYTVEEHKMTNESRKILHDDGLRLSATCVRVPVPVGHSEAVHVDLDRSIEESDIRAALNAFPGVTVVDDPQRTLYPMPHTAEGKDEVLVGRIRRDMSSPRGIAFWLSCDNLRKGAALNALQIMDEVIRRDALSPAATHKA
ncbi:MAG TPA: aspartate-semialdehyde dehydrogenase [Candidatus Krumholzibacteria bacterium]|nr:aspartate-semialdehyde dehydrogenase [Candidatus Krumholzibacteria bacterium]